MIFITDNSVKEFMTQNRLKKIRLYITAYLDSSNYQTWGYSKVNVNSDYYFSQKVISRKTKTFFN